MVNRCEVIPGLSDHDIPFLDISTKIVFNKKAQRKTFLYNKADLTGLTNDLQEFNEKFCGNNANSPPDVESMWTRIKEAITSAIDKFVPSKIISSKKQSLPWITHQIKKEIKKRDRLFAK